MRPYVEVFGSNSPVPARQESGAHDRLSKIEGIIPALESAHAIAYVSSNLAPSLTKDQKILVTLSGRGDKDLGTIMSLDDQDSS